jgi:hypothetical protein
VWRAISHPSVTARMVSDICADLACAGIPVMRVSRTHSQTTRDLE